jgi:hypothetical protein
MGAAALGALRSCFVRAANGTGALCATARPAARRPPVRRARCAPPRLARAQTRSAAAAARPWPGPREATTLGAWAGAPGPCTPPGGAGLGRRRPCALVRRAAPLP